MADQRSGMASMEQLAELWRALLSNLLKVFKRPKSPSVELLQCARKFLKDNGHVYPPDETARKLVEKLQRLYLERLVEAMDAGPASPALLGEARQFLTWADLYPSLTPQSAGLAAVQLLEMEMPFATKH